MLSYLKIQNLAIIESSEIEFSQGLNVITGETGAGKSIILKAINLLCGARASSELVRHGCETCSVEGLFNLSAAKLEQINSASEEIASLINDEQIVIKRQLDKSGKGKIFVNGSLVSLNSLQLLASYLVEITGQHQHQSLTNTTHQRAVLDQCGVKQETLSQVYSNYIDYIRADKELKELKEKSAKKDENLSTLKEQASQLKQANLKQGEKQAVLEQVNKFAHFETLSSKVSSCIELLSSNDGPCEMLRKSQYLIEDAVKIDQSLASINEILESSVAQANEACNDLEKYLNKLEIDPESLELARERLAEISHLERKYKKSNDELIDWQQQLDSQIKELEESDWSIQKLQKNCEEKLNQLRKAEQALTAERKKAAVTLSKAVEKELDTLGMGGAKFNIEIDPQESSSIGADSINFMLAANKGEGFRPLAKVASGGELSRVLLILKLATGGNSCPTQIFDEIDTGIGGAVAGMVAERLKAIAKENQVILITHSAQIASYADVHLLAQKQAEQERTTSSIKILSQEQRIENIAIMLAGQKDSKKIKETAKELLTSNQKRS
jgi:DNA repair protein RecN (Recombination protein N)